MQAVLSDRTVDSASKEESLSLSAAQWNRMSSLLPVLEGLQIATTAMSTEQNVSGSCILPVVNGLKINFLKPNPSDTSLIKSLKKKVSADLSRRFLQKLEADSVVAVASCIDPRHKTLKSLPESLRFLVHEHARSLVNEAESTSICETGDEAQPPAKKSAMTSILYSSSHYR